MQVISAPQEFNVSDLYVELGQRLYLKCEGFNFAGSIKLKAAAEMVADAERAGLLGEGSTIVESSSGNLGVALALVAKSRGYGFVCVTDARCTLAARQLMQTLGATVQVITEPHPDRGLLGARIDRVNRLCAESERYVWLNQYANEANWGAHHRTTAREILRDVPELDVLFIGAGTTGTLMGCARYFAEVAPHVRVVAVDTVGSVTFGHPPARRMIPGLGTAVRPALLDESYIHDVVLVPERDTIAACRELAGRGFLFGGSTGTVVSGARRWLAEHESAGLTAVAIAPDLGERYLDTVYSEQWVQNVYGSEPILPELSRTSR
ncbi:2,3-diaminopropionate biosynthesis protein SbnA [Sciscionella sediminilitoris]|uniref:2,3-diaminopropionate biosynthesis protein SbnA n=1 Tax=Sciscionella sediminilitoris TaxID=1445613 RepID=UPI0004DEEFFB|nr:2,3-diaminopropionate biosynthesis protein SbnA [Sciscionella sp. SE31]